MLRNVLQFGILTLIRMGYGREKITNGAKVEKMVQSVIVIVIRQ